jgi:hypothetical protein
LLEKAEETGFGVLITKDSNMTFQLNAAGNRLKIVVVRACSNRLADTIPSTPKILQILRYIENGRDFNLMSNEEHPTLSQLTQGAKG